MNINIMYVEIMYKSLDNSEHRMLPMAWEPELEGDAVGVCMTSHTIGSFKPQSTLKGTNEPSSEMFAATQLSAPVSAIM